MIAPAPASQVHVAALYRFAPLPGFRELRQPLAEFCCSRNIKGTLLLAQEGVNGTLAGSADAIAQLVARLESIEGLAPLEVKYSDASQMPFHRMKVRLKREIVTMGVPDLDPVNATGTYVEPADWNALISDPRTLVVDTRNMYETAIGTFQGAVDPLTTSFSEFPDWALRHRDELSGRKVAMFCTGGIRCEKATAFVRSLGIDEVYHLRGGILRYLEETPEDQSLWKGECFVFDERVSVGHGVREGDASLCRACRHPLMAQDRTSPLFVDGVSCHHCHHTRSNEDRARYAERQRQVELAQKRGDAPHIGR